MFMAMRMSMPLQGLLAKTAVLKLNGGLGTSMGLAKAKSLLVVKDGKTFLDLIADQIKYTRSQFGSNVRFVLMNRHAPAMGVTAAFAVPYLIAWFSAHACPAPDRHPAGRSTHPPCCCSLHACMAPWLGNAWSTCCPCTLHVRVHARLRVPAMHAGVVLLNLPLALPRSFSTSADTKAYLSKAHADLISEPDVELVQNKSPKVDAATLEPASYPEDPEQEWCAPRIRAAALLPVLHLLPSLCFEFIRATVVRVRPHFVHIRRAESAPLLLMLVHAQAPASVLQQCIMGPGESTTP
jgi:hypothetical protein